MIVIVIMTAGDQASVCARVCMRPVCVYKNKKHKTQFGFFYSY